MKLWKKSNNRGASLVGVIVAMTVIAVLGVTIMYVAYSNYNMKAVNKKAKSNFYTAERVLDEISAGLKQEMSVEYEKAYITVMAKYGSYLGSADLEQDFRTEFILNMVEKLHLPGSENRSEDGTAGLTMDNRYSVNHLASFVQGSYNGVCTVSTVEQGKNLLQTVEDGIILRNIRITYQEKGYSNAITTDIKLTVPGIQFTKASTGMVDFLDFAYVADDGIVLQNAVKVTIDGKAYSGSTSNNPSVSLQHDTVLNAEASDLFVAGGDVKLVAHSSLLTGIGTDFWANGIFADVSSGTTKQAQNSLSFLGTTYVADDMTLAGRDNVLTLGGKYIGYSGGNEAAQSSALIVNGLNTKLDLSDLDTLVLAGTAFVSASSMVSDQTGYTNSLDIRTGESLALKSNQVAYLVPADCAGIHHNPMTYTSGTDSTGEYNQLISDPEWEEKALNSIIPALSRSIASYGSVQITPVYSNEQGGCVYLFLNFSNVSEAAAYFRDVYHCDGLTGKKLRDSMQNYLVLQEASEENVHGQAGFRMSDSCNVIMNGNYLLSATYDEDLNLWTSDYVIADKATGDLTGNLTSYGNKYKALCTKLTESMSDMTLTEQSRTVYQNLIDEEALREILDGTLKNGEATITRVDSDTVILSKMSRIGGQNVNIKAVLTDNAGGSAYTVTQDGNGVIIATGDVTLSANWTGTVICGGLLTLSDNANMKLCSSEEITTEAVTMKCQYEGRDGYASAAKAIIGGDNLDSNADDSSSEEGQYDRTDVRNCVSYENWKSE